jgi:hypothetical protein
MHDTPQELDIDHAQRGSPRGPGEEAYEVRGAREAREVAAQPEAASVLAPTAQPPSAIFASTVSVFPIGAAACANSRGSSFSNTNGQQPQWDEVPKIRRDG